MTVENIKNQSDEYFCFINLSGGYVWVSDQNPEVDSTIKNLLSDCMRDSVNDGIDSFYSEILSDGMYLHARVHFFDDQVDDKGRKGIILLVGAVSSDKNIAKILDPDYYLSKFVKFRDFMLYDVQSKDFINLIISEILSNANKLQQIKIYNSQTIIESTEYNIDNSDYIEQKISLPDQIKHKLNRFINNMGWVLLCMWVILITYNVYLLWDIKRDISYLTFNKKPVVEQKDLSQRKKVSAKPQPNANQ